MTKLMLQVFLSNGSERSEILSCSQTNGLQFFYFEHGGEEEEASELFTPGHLHMAVDLIQGICFRNLIFFLENMKFSTIQGFYFHYAY